MAVRELRGKKLLEYIFDRKGGQSRQPLRFIQAACPFHGKQHDADRGKGKVKGKLFGNLLRYLAEFYFSGKDFLEIIIFQHHFLSGYFIPVLGKYFHDQMIFVLGRPHRFVRIPYKLQDLGHRLIIFTGIIHDYHKACKNADQNRKQHDFQQSDHLSLIVLLFRNGYERRTGNL